MGKIYCIMGKSASGKDTLYKNLLQEINSLGTYVMYTTRPMRAGETEGVEYHFITDEELSGYEKAGKVIEKRQYNTMRGLWTYCTIDDGQIDLSEKDYLSLETLESYKALSSFFGSEKLVPIYLELDDGERLQRALDRERLQKVPHYEEMCRRFLADSEDFSEEKLLEDGIYKRFDSSDADKLLRKVKEEFFENDFIQ